MYISKRKFLKVGVKVKNAYRIIELLNIKKITQNINSDPMLVPHIPVWLFCQNDTEINGSTSSPSLGSSPLVEPPPPRPAAPFPS